MKDLTLSAYRQLLNSLINQDYNITSNIKELVDSKAVMLRHDVDSWPKNALQMGKIEHALGIKAIYYFRTNWQSYDKRIITDLEKLGHVIGYHYEDLCDCNGDIDKAFIRFKSNLSSLRKICTISTASMHGRPLSKWDSKDIWKKYEYKSLGIEFEPYLDIDYSEIAYLTDTGGRWDGELYSVRDNVAQDFTVNASTTFDLIRLADLNELPERLLVNIHPARWNNNLFKWMVRKYILTQPKLYAKTLIKKYRGKR